MTEVAWGYREGSTITLEELQQQVGPGWKQLVKRCFDICVEHSITVTQVKEKYGGLRFYVGSAPFAVLDVLDECERLSYTICEQCGSDTAEPRPDGWIKTLCDACFDLRKEQ